MACCRLYCLEETVASKVHAVDADPSFEDSHILNLLRKQINLRLTVLPLTFMSFVTEGGKVDKVLWTRSSEYLLNLFVVLQKMCIYTHIYVGM